MLKTLDVAVGFAFVMLVASSAVTVLTQTLVNALQLRGWTLRDGLARLLRQADGVLSEAGARDLAEAVLRHPLLSGVNGRRAAVVGREELVPVLLHLAAQPVGQGGKDANGRQAARELVARTSLGSPADALRDIRHLELRIEGADPGVARHVRAAQAVITAAASDLTAVLFSWFDATMERVRDRFVSHTRWITVGGALVVTLALPLDAIRLVNRLSTDAALRDVLVANGGAAAGAPSAEVSKETRGVVFESLGFRPFSDEWWASLQAASASGLLLSWLLLSLGAPFWFELLKNLTRLRPPLAQRDEEERQERSSGEPAPSRKLVVSGESGELVVEGRG